MRGGTQLMSGDAWPAGAWLAISLFLASCTTTTYVAYNDGGESVPLFERRVAYRISDNFYRNPPDCAVILALGDTAFPALNDLVEGALFRHMVGKLRRVIGPLERRRITRRLAVDLKNPADGRVFARMERCAAFVRATVTVAANDFVLVWARRSLGLDIALVGFADQTVHWQARHSASRSDGGLPLSPFSVPMSIFEAARLHADDDILPSMVDDAVRRAVATLPDVR